MNGIHDMGGMQDLGPVQIGKEDQKSFHAAWEGRCWSLCMSLDVDWAFMRSQVELMPPVDYLRSNSVERYLAALPAVITNAGMVTSAELASGRAGGKATGNWEVTTPAQIASWFAPDPGLEQQATPPARFAAGQRIRAKNINPVGHTRLPRYVRGKSGTVERAADFEDLPDAVAAGLGKNTQHVYTVRFAARELWGQQANVRDSVYLDLWEDYLDPA